MAGTVCLVTFSLATAAQRWGSADDVPAAVCMARELPSAALPKPGRSDPIGGMMYHPNSGPRCATRRSCRLRLSPLRRRWCASGSHPRCPPRRMPRPTAPIIRGAVADVPAACRRWEHCSRGHRRRRPTAPHYRRPAQRQLCLGAGATAGNAQHGCRARGRGAHGAPCQHRFWRSPHTTAPT